MTTDALIPGYFDGSRVVFEEDVDGAFDAVLVDRWGFQIARAFGATREEAEAALNAEREAAKKKTTDWL